MYARVVVDTGAASTIDSLTYEVPDGLAGSIGAGSCVLVPLASRQAVGYVIGFEDHPAVEETRPIIAEIDSPVRLDADLFPLAQWISAEYMCPLSRVVAAMLPGVMHCKVQARIHLELASDTIRLTPQERLVYDSIASCPEAPAPESLKLEIDKSALQRVLRQLENKGAVKRLWQLLPPSGQPKTMRGVRLVKRSWVDERLSELPVKQAEAMEIISGIGRDISLVELTQRFGVSRAPITALEKKGLLEPVEITFRRDPAFVRMEQVKVTLTDEQQQAIEAITTSVNSNSYNCHLLFGVTASGKTEVYLRCIEHALSLGKTSLVLLPEIALTTQVMNIFKSRFGNEVAVLHSALSAGERCDEWARASEGEAKVVLGARSAIFAPIRNLGLVIVDEEHEGSYKQDSHPRYNARDVAMRRAKASNAALVLGSATPSIESFYAARQGGYHLISMPNRVESRPMPKVYIADLREEYAKGKATIFSSRLEEAIRDRLERKRQVILLQNRRAYSTFLLCRDCGFVMRCPNCAVALKFHSGEHKVTCHHCNYTRPAPDVCPSCQGERIKKFGIGTERVEEETLRIFPTARVLRMDRDTTARKGAHASILNTFRRGEADILVGTQMIAKGLDFPNVTLVGVISADTSLNLPDFRAAERTFQLISQVAGRSGRGTEPGEVVIQTMDPDNYAVECAVEHDYVGFYEKELELRNELHYPPFSSLINIISRDEDCAAAGDRLEQLVKEIKTMPMAARKGIDIVGPAPAVLSKLKGEYRWHMAMRSADKHAMLNVLREVMERNSKLRRNLTVDVDPMSML